MKDDLGHSDTDGNSKCRVDPSHQMRASVQTKGEEGSRDTLDVLRFGALASDEHS